MRRRKPERTDWEVLELPTFEMGGITKAFALEILHKNNIRAISGGHSVYNGWGKYTIKVDSKWINKAEEILNKGDY